MNSKYLILIVSNEFRSLIAKDDSPVELGSVVLRTHKEPVEHERSGFFSTLTDLLKDAQRVRIAAHLSTCFEMEVGSRGGFQIRFSKEETKLRSDTGVHDLELWGFSHETEHSPIWASLKEIAAAMKTESFKDARTRIDLGSRLCQAFAMAEANNIYERFTVCRHHILGLFVATRVDFEFAAELEHTDFHGAHDLHHKTVRRIAEKIDKAKNVFEGGMEEIRQYVDSTNDLRVQRAMKENKSKVMMAMSVFPDVEKIETSAPNFVKWLSNLDQSLDLLRNGLK